MNKLILVVFVLVSFWVFPNPQDVSACSGGATSRINLEYFMQNADIVVRGKVVDRDATQENGRLLVSEYLIGEPGNPSLLITQTEQSEVVSGRMGIITCEPLEILPEASEVEYIFFLQKHLDGSYSKVTHSQVAHITFLEEESTVGFTKSVDSEFVEYDLTESELLEAINANPRPPLDMHYFGVISPAPMIILTEANTAYMLSVDGREVVKLAEQVESYTASGSLIVLTTPDQYILYERWSGDRYNFERSPDLDCKNINCVAFTRNGVFLGLQMSVNEFLLCDFPHGYSENVNLDAQVITPTPCGYALRDWTGQGFQFSGDNDAFAVWNENKITVYTGLVYPNRSWQEAESHPINLSSSLYSEIWFNGQGVWSADGRWLAYTDAEGLWMWDVYTQEPELIIPAGENSIATARHFSPSGRYLAITDSERHYILDLYSGLEFPDGVISPDERQLIAADTVEGKPVPSEHCDLRTGECSSLCYKDNEPIQGVTYAVVWHESQFGYPPITNRIQNDCDISPDEVTTFPKYIFLDEYYWGILASGYELQFPYLLREHDLEELIDAPIREIEFLPAIYFGQNPIY